VGDGRRFTVSTTTVFVRPCEKLWRTVSGALEDRFSVSVLVGVTVSVSPGFFVSVIPCQILGLAPFLVQMLVSARRRAVIPICGIDAGVRRGLPSCGGPCLSKTTVAPVCERRDAVQEAGCGRARVERCMYHI
jgi:hypothetical protein